MGHRRSSLDWPVAVLLAVAGALSLSAGHAQESAGPSCVAKIGAVLADIAARDLDTSRGPPAQEQQAVEQIAGNQRGIVAALDRLRLDALLYPVDGRGGARNDESPDTACFLAGASGLPAAAFPVGLDRRGLPVGLELIGRPQSDEALVAMMAAFEQARVPLPKPKPIPPHAELAALDIPRLNELHLRLGWSAFRTRHDNELGAPAPDKFRALTDELAQTAIGKR